MNAPLTSKTNSACREQFDMWAENLGLCMDEIFLSSDGVPENPFEDGDTKNFYAAWLAAWEACEALSERPAHETKTPQLPIARVIVREDEAPGLQMYAPGLPPGAHELYCEPETVAPYMRDPAPLSNEQMRSMVDSMRITEKTSEPEPPHCATCTCEPLPHQVLKPAADVSAVPFQGCEFVGPPPVPYESWNQWAALPVYSGVTIQASSPRIGGA